MRKKTTAEAAQLSTDEIQAALDKATSSPGVAEVLEVYRRTSEIIETVNSFMPGRRYFASVSNATG